MHHEKDHQAEIPDFTPTYDKHPRPYWRRMHHDWKFWVAIVFISLALGIYVVTVDLSSVPRPALPAN